MQNSDHFRKADHRLGVALRAGLFVRPGADSNQKRLQMRQHGARRQLQQKPEQRPPRRKARRCVHQSGSDDRSIRAENRVFQECRNRISARISSGGRTAAQSETPARRRQNALPPLPQHFWHECNEWQSANRKRKSGHDSGKNQAARERANSAQHAICDNTSATIPIAKPTGANARSE